MVPTLLHYKHNLKTWRQHAIQERRLVSGRVQQEPPRPPHWRPCAYHEGKTKPKSNCGLLRRGIQSNKTKPFPL
jgi:hypothetical protein